VTASHAGDVLGVRGARSPWPSDALDRRARGGERAPNGVEPGVESPGEREQRAGASLRRPGLRDRYGARRAKRRFDPGGGTGRPIRRRHRPSGPEAAPTTGSGSPAPATPPLGGG